jgi:hypothetical protein
MIFEKKRVPAVSYRRENWLIQLIDSASTHIGDGGKAERSISLEYFFRFLCQEHLVRLLKYFWLSYDLIGSSPCGNMW